MTIKKESKLSFKSDLIKSIIIGATIASVTAILNFLLFVNQFNINSSDKKLEKKIQILDDTSTKLYHILSNGNDKAFLDVYFDILNKKWTDSLKIKSLVFSDHEKMLKELEVRHPREYSLANKFDTHNKELNHTLFIARLYFISEEVHTAIDNFNEHSTPPKRRALYERFRDNYMKRNNAPYEQINAYAISDSIRIFYGGLGEEVLFSMAREINN